MDTASKAAQDREDRKQVRMYAKARPRYAAFAAVVNKVLTQAAKRLAPEAIVQTRAKTVASFAGKIVRRRGDVVNPIAEFTDLCGGRVIVHFQKQMDAVCRFIEQRFDVDLDNSSDVVDRLKPAEFGYRSVHYIVSFNENIRPDENRIDAVPREVYGLKGEIQVRTILQHGWADFTHDMSYKSAFPIPTKWKREIARLAATLEVIDGSFDRIAEGLAAYAANYGAYMTKEQMQDEIANLEAVLRYDKENTDLAVRIARLAMACGWWKKAIGTLTPCVVSRKKAPPPHGARRDLGFALCKQYAEKKKGRQYRLGQELLRQAASAKPGDADAMAMYAGTFKGVNAAEERRWYLRAHETDPSAAEPLAKYLELEIARQKDVTVVSSMASAVETAIERCRAQADVGMNLPFVFYYMGVFRLLRRKPYAAVADFAKAIQLSTAPFMIEDALGVLERLSVVAGDLPGFEWIRRLLGVGMVAHCIGQRQKTESDLAARRAEADAEQKTLNVMKKGTRRRIKKDRGALKKQTAKGKAAEDAVKEARNLLTAAKAAVTRTRTRYLEKTRLVTRKLKPFGKPVIMLVGGASFLEAATEKFKPLLMEAFRDFKGTLICGGTTAGIPGVAGEIGRTYRDNIYTLGYLPSPPLPEDAVRDRRYRKIYRTDGKGFSPLEPLQSWIDLIAMGIDPSHVKVLGINGGTIAAAEYRIALALGAPVGVIEESGREAARLLPDEDWRTASNLYQLPKEALTVKAFVESGNPRLDPPQREAFAKDIHAGYRRDHIESPEEDNPSMAKWDKLDNGLKEDNRQQADGIYAKLRRIGCRAVKVTDRKIRPMYFSDDEIEIMAQMEHARWNVGRLLSGWRLGPEKDVEKKISPYLVPWSELAENVRDWDRNAVRRIPDILEQAQLEIQSL